MRKFGLSKSFILLVLSAFLLVLNVSCSHITFKTAPTAIERSVAQTELSQYELADLVERALEVNRTSKKSNINLSPKFYSKDFSLKLSRLDFIENNNLPKDIAFKIYPYLKNNEYYIQIQYSAQTKFDQGAYLELKQFFSIFNDKQLSPSVAKQILAPILGKDAYKETSFFELIYNAKKGDLRSIKELLTKKIGGHSNNVAFFKEKVKLLDKILENQKEENIFYKKIFELKNDPLFLQKIATNDRKSVAALINRKIPWSKMTPFEVNFWKTQLEIMENPLPYEKRIIIYRGLKTSNLINSYQNSKQKIINSQNFFQVANFFFSNGDITNAYLDNSLATSTVSNNLKIHSIQSAKSLFISVTPHSNVARSFAEDAVVALAVDPRSIFFNEASSFIDESEYLMSFVSFPEDVLAIVEVNGKEKKMNPVESFKLENKISEKIANNLKKKKSGKVTLHSQLKQNTSNHFHSFNFSTKTQRNVIHNILQRELEASPEVIMRQKTPSLVQGCFNLIKSFF